jgi:hypothetical protein
MRRSTAHAGPDSLTLIAVSSLAYVLAVALHEHARHSLACVMLGGQPKQMGAFYVDCGYEAMSSLSIRVVALAGPAMSLLMGAVSFLALRRVPGAARLSYYFVWLLGSLGLMSAAGYLLFSGVSGLGDLGTSRDGALYGLAPAWIGRLALTALGFVGYRRVLRIMWRTMAPQLAGSDVDVIGLARRMALLSYMTGAAVYLAIGLLNPQGFEVIALSVLPSSLGGSCGLLLFWKMAPRGPSASVPGPGLNFARNWCCISVAAAVTLAYAALFGPTLRF